MPTLTWCGSMMNPSRFIIQDLVGSVSMSDLGQERTVDMMTYFHSLPVVKQTKEKRSEITFYTPNSATIHTYLKQHLHVKCQNIQL